ncbi:BrnT family toxin [candidate division KSB1 bacterium]|nr:BrnT family toxin [candidate division KSB1 bacterium]
MDKIYDIIRDCTGFNWDKYNINKNWEKHNVTPVESEQVFFNNPFIITADIKHTKVESRYYALGKTDRGRKLFIAFTIRNSKIRVISSRDMSKKERDEYEQHN